MNKKIQSPLLRIHPAAHDHLYAIIEVFKNSGRPISMSRWVSDLILSQPLPNGNGHIPPADPCPDKENR